MRILWFCNTPMSDVDGGGSGTWLQAMFHGLLDAQGVELGIVAYGSAKQFCRRDHRWGRQWIMPDSTPLGRDGLPPDLVVQDIVAAVNEFAPDLIHVWGTETAFGLLTARGLFSCPSLLEIQGLKGTIAPVFYGDLTFRERLATIGIKEWIKRRSIHTDRRECTHWSLHENEMILNHRFVDVQSPWVAAHVRAINPDAVLFPVELALRPPFYAVAWRSANRPNIFCTAAYTAPFKGLHVAVRALALLKRTIPDVRLRIAGAHQRTGIRQNGYIRWINRLIERLGLVDEIDWLGPLNADRVAEELSEAAAAVIPSFIESYGVAVAEAMSVGTPTIVAYTGGTSHLGRDEESCLFFPSGDETMCAHQLERVLNNSDLALHLSQQAKRITGSRNDCRLVVQRQMEIYRQILDEGTN